MTDTKNCTCDEPGEGLCPVHGIENMLLVIDSLLGHSENAVDGMLKDCAVVIRGLEGELADCKSERVQVLAERDGANQRDKNSLEAFAVIDRLAVMYKQSIETVLSMHVSKETVLSTHESEDACGCDMCCELRQALVVGIRKEDEPKTVKLLQAIDIFQRSTQPWDVCGCGVCRELRQAWLLRTGKGGEPKTVKLDEQFTTADADAVRCQPYCQRQDNRNMPPGKFRDVYDTIIKHSQVLLPSKQVEPCVQFLDSGDLLRTSCPPMSEEDPKEWAARMADVSVKAGEAEYEEANCPHCKDALAADCSPLEKDTPEEVVAQCVGCELYTGTDPNDGNCSLPRDEKCIRPVVASTNKQGMEHADPSIYKFEPFPAKVGTPRICPGCRSRDGEHNFGEGCTLRSERENPEKYNQMVGTFRMAESKEEMEKLALAYIRDMSYARSDICLALKAVEKEKGW